LPQWATVKTPFFPILRISGVFTVRRIAVLLDFCNLVFQAWVIFRTGDLGDLITEVDDLREHLRKAVVNAEAQTIKKGLPSSCNFPNSQTLNAYAISY
jgi:hypothetical protein